MKLRVAALAVFTAAQAVAQSNVMVIQGARVIDGTGAPAKVETVVIRGNRIASVGGLASIPPGARIIDARGQTLIPGLFDLHTHMPYSTVTGLAGDWGKNLEAYLACGITSVDDFGSYGEMFAPMRRLLETGVVRGPRLHLAVRISPPGGHGTESGWGDTFTLEASTAAEAHAAMKRALPYKPDVIKVFTDGWRYDTIPNLMSMNEETIAAIVQDAHRAGLKVLTHTLTLANAKITVRAGVDSLAHGVNDQDVDDQLIELMKSNGTGYVSTLAVFEPRNRSEIPSRMAKVLEPLVEELIKRPATPSAEVQASSASIRAEHWRHLLHNDKALFDAGIKVGTGTDAGVAGVHHGWSTLRELELQVEAGLSPLQAISAATSVSAAILGVDKDLGTIQPGKLADAVLLRGKPDERIEDIENTEHVFLDGKEYDPAELERGIKSDAMTKLPSHTLPALVDDMERADERTELGTLKINATDLGIDHSKIFFSPVWRKENDHALMIQASMGPKEHSYVLLQVPLTAGGIELADASAYQGISFDARGDGMYQLKFVTYGVRMGQEFHAPFRADATWTTQRIPFSALVRTAEKSIPWTGRDLRILQFELDGPAGSNRWLELDNLRFF